MNPDRLHGAGAGTVSRAVGSGGGRDELRWRSPSWSVCLPHCSTNRFWFSALQIPPSESSIPLASIATFAQPHKVNNTGWLGQPWEQPPSSAVPWPTSLLFRSSS